ncbi:MAG: hypothetical protein P1S60_16325 [Anaerolineae bacterium]|nr:hypothetical protein [Anaerolineae bacterium]
MNKYIEAHQQSWSLLARDHDETCKKRLAETDNTLSAAQISELGTITDKKLIHRQCNTGADTISLARLGARVTGVDLSPDNIHFARLLAQDFGVRESYLTHFR